MSAVVYCGSMGDWPLLTEAQRQEGVARLVAAGIPTIVGTGAVNSKPFLMQLMQKSRCTRAYGNSTCIITWCIANCTKGTLFCDSKSCSKLTCGNLQQPVLWICDSCRFIFELRREFPNLIGFKEFGGAADMRYAAEFITSQDDSVTLMAGVDTQVFHGFVNCNATGAITGIGNALPKEVLQLVDLSKKAAAGDAKARRLAQELSSALEVLSSFDEGTDLVLYYKYLMVLNGDKEYTLHFNETDALSESQRKYVETQYELFRTWYRNWSAEI